MILSRLHNRQLGEEGLSGENGEKLLLKRGCFAGSQSLACDPEESPIYAYEVSHRVAAVWSGMEIALYDLYKGSREEAYPVLFCLLPRSFKPFVSLRDDKIYYGIKRSSGERQWIVCIDRRENSQKSLLADRIWTVGSHFILSSSKHGKGLYLYREGKEGPECCKISPNALLSPINAKNDQKSFNGLLPCHLAAKTSDMIYFVAKRPDEKKGREVIAFDLSGNSHERFFLPTEKGEGRLLFCAVKEGVLYCRDEQGGCCIADLTEREILIRFSVTNNFEDHYGFRNNFAVYGSRIHFISTDFNQSLLVCHDYRKKRTHTTGIGHAPVGSLKIERGIVVVKIKKKLNGDFDFAYFFDAGTGALLKTSGSLHLRRNFRLDRGLFTWAEGNILHLRSLR